MKSRAAELGVHAGELESSDIHIHVPADAIPKDGPSVGVAMYVALVSLDGIDQTPAFDLTDPAPVPEYAFDQTVFW